MNKRSPPTQEIPATDVPSSSFSVQVRPAGGAAITTAGTATFGFDPANENMSSKPLRRPNRLRPHADAKDSEPGVGADSR
jgi:hypothetical protein